ncbi:MAG: nucleotidyltransferase domain-containing protein [Candidatus Lokiarchaeota archaeon]|nr:nucleotidyltransferase domain-containing protein [Candidatus Lokiarchaeota archaeon]
MNKRNMTSDLKNYSEYWHNKIQKRKELLTKRKKKLRNLAKDCADILKREFGVKEVYLIGSLLEDHKIHLNSDIDLAILGLKDEEYFLALRRLYSILPKNVNIDLIDIPTASESMNELIKTQGEQL